ncbi:DUF4910 domain-containing protein [Peribacillus kribbensis]|uniref:DUF4910 domain-containing protein n=1 Tax=Peribacillus kribbensis TaxID=356658 RepID=UPI0003F521FF|nr:DUF4910 domain-containing protein [Peribacillus kribbensis]
MFESWRKVLDEEFSGRQAYRYAERIGQYHRIQASPGYREAASQIISLLKREGVEAELVPYPAVFGNRLLSHRSFKEWHCRSAELWIESPARERIARFHEEEISLVQRSISTGPEGVTAELVVVDNAGDEKSYKNLDLKGKVALVQGVPHVVHALAVEKYGAAGLIFENLNDYPPLRTRMDMPDTRQYTSYWWTSEEERKSFGFVVSPRIGQKLRQLAARQRVVLSAHVDAELYDGSYENIEYFIPGKKKEEILLVSHLCHPYPGGQDNASGPGTLMEIMRSLTKLITTGKLQKPELGIRFLMMPEMYGTCAYLDQHPERIPNTIAALNLDMVGADQTKGGGPLCIEQPPLSCPTFTDRYLHGLVEVLAQNTSNFTGTTSYSTVHYLRTRHSGGSDHYILSDSTIGIPCPMLIQWPDKHYHTTSDSVANLDSSMMKLTGMAAALYAYGLAAGSEQEWISYLFKHAGRMQSELSSQSPWILKQSFTRNEKTEASELFTRYERQVLEKFEDYAELRDFNELNAQLQWAKGMLGKAAEAQTQFMEQQLDYFQAFKEEEDKEQPSMEAVYARTFAGPIKISDELKEDRLDWMQEYESKTGLGYSDFIFNWMDGNRPLAEVLKLTKLETGMCEPSYVKKLIELCLRAGLIEEKVSAVHK